MRRIIEQSKATVHVKGRDCEYSAEFLKVWEEYWLYELEPMADCPGMTKKIDSGKMRVIFTPNTHNMAFPDDKERKRDYTMPIEKARELYADLIEGRAYWFALDMADLFSKSK